MDQTGVMKSPILCFCLISILFLLSEIYNVLRGIGKPYVMSLDSRSGLPRLPYGSNCSHKITEFVFLPYIYFTLASTALECIKRYWETLHEESR